MQNRYQYYTLTLETLSPVHIGCGESLTKLDYIYSEASKTVYVLDPMKLFRGLSRYGLLRPFEAGLGRSTSMTDFITGSRLSENVYKTWAAYSFPAAKSVVRRGQMEIQKFVKDAYGMPYIPGSGLKGALRTALAANAILRPEAEYAQTAGRIRAAVSAEQKFADKKRKMREKYSMKKWFLKQDAESLETDIFHTLSRKKDRDKNPIREDILNDCMAGLMISDSRPLTGRCLMLSQKIDAFLNDENSINTLRESVKPQTSVQFDLTVDTQLCPYSAAEILHAGAQMMDLYQTRFRKRFLNSPLPKTDAAHEMLLYLGGGTGFWHKTVLNALFADAEQGARTTANLLDLQFPRAKHPAFTQREGISPKALKATVSEQSRVEMGLCRLRFEEKKV